MIKENLNVEEEVARSAVQSEVSPSSVRANEAKDAAGRNPHRISSEGERFPIGEVARAPLQKKIPSTIKCFAAAMMR